MISLDSLSRHSKTEVGPWLNPVIDFAKGVIGSEHFVEGDILESCALIQSEEGGGCEAQFMHSDIYVVGKSEGVAKILEDSL